MKLRGLAAVAVVTLAAVLAACGGGSVGFDASQRSDADDTGPRWTSLSPPAGLYRCGADVAATVDTRVIDSHVTPAAVHIAVDPRDAAFYDPNWNHPLRVSVLQGSIELAVLVDAPNAQPGVAVNATWDATVGGAPAPVGTYFLRVAYGCSDGSAPVEREIPISVVRVGTVSVVVGDGDGTRVPMLWHRLNHVARNYWLPPNSRPVLVRGTGTGVTDLDQPNGAVRPFPAVSTDLETPPVDASGEPVTSDYSLPFAIGVTTHPDVTLRFGFAAPMGPAPVMDGGTSANAVRVRARVREANTATDVLLSDGATGTFRTTALPAPAVGRFDLTLHVQFEYDRGDGTWGPVSSESIPLTAYGLLGNQTIQLNTDAPYAAWYAIVDAVAGWVGGSTADPDRVAGIIVHHVFDDLGLHYDTVHGASFYTTYRTGFSGANFDLSAFLARDNGTTVNCSDCASIVSTYANMIGCDLGYQIIQGNFLLDYIHAIGTPGFTNDPFGSGHQGSFRYHAITAASDSGLVFDATLHEDGDSNPASPPFLETVVDGLMQNFYLGHLSPVSVSVTHDDKTSIE